MANPFYVHPGSDFGHSLQSLAGQVRDIGEQRKIESAKKKADEIRLEATQTYKTGDPDKIAQFMLKYPEMSEVIKQASLFHDEATKKNYKNSILSALKDPSKIEEIVSKRREFLSSQGVPQENRMETDGFIDRMDGDFESVKKGLELDLAVIDPKLYKSYSEIYKKDEDEKLPTTAMGQFIKQNPNANAEDLADFTAQLSKAKEVSNKTPTYAPSSLKKLIDERQALIDQGFPIDHPDVDAYNNKINGVDIDLEDMTQDEIDFWGANVNLTGKVPSLGRGKQSTKIRMAIAKSAARQALGADIDEVPEGTPTQTPAEAALEVVSTQSDTKAIQGSLNFLDKQLSSMGSFVTNLNSQIDKVSELSKDLKTFDTRILNVPLRSVRGRVKGSPLQAKYDLYLSEIEAEIGKLATGSTGSVAELSVGAQEKWSKIHDKNLSIKDMLDLLEETKEAANFRLDSVRQELNNVRTRARTRDYGTQERSIYREGQTATGPGGQKIVFKNGNWEEI